MTAIYRPRFTGRALVLRGGTVTLPFTMTLDSVASVPSVLAATLIRPDGTEIAADSTTTASATFTVPSTDALGEGWSVKWEPDALEFVQPASLVAYLQTYSVSSADLIQYHPELTSQYPPGDTTAESFVAIAQREVDQWLLKQGRRPWLALPDGALFSPTVFLALARWFRSLSTGEDSRFGQLADYYETKAEDALATAKLSIDYDEDQQADASEQGKTAGPVVIHLSGRY